MTNIMDELYFIIKFVCCIFMSSDTQSLNNDVKTAKDITSSNSKTTSICKKK